MLNYSTIVPKLTEQEIQLNYCTAISNRLVISEFLIYLLFSSICGKICERKKKFPNFSISSSLERKYPFYNYL